jgi:hypothetical protein
MTVHLAQVAAVQGPILFLWDLDEQSSVCASVRIMGSIEPEFGALVRVSYEGLRPVSLERASDAELTAQQRAAMLSPETTAEEERLYRLIWDD